MFSFFKNQKLIDNASDTLLMQVNSYARNPKYFGDDKVTDDPDGRFELITLFSVAYFTALSGRDEFSSRISQKLFDKIFKSFDDALRDLGVGDLSVGKRVRRLAEGFYGRQVSYKNAIEADDWAMFEDKIALNVFGRETSSHQFEKTLTDDIKDLYFRLKGLGTDEILSLTTK